MMRKEHIVLIALSIFLFACSSTKHIPDNDKLYTGASVIIKDEDLTVRQKKVIREDLGNLPRPKPNSRLLGIPVKLNFYNLFYNAKPNSFFGKLRDRWGEPPVLLSQVDLPNNIKVLQNYLENKGFFKASVTGDTIVKGKKARAEYTATTGPQYTIASISFPTDSNDLSNTIRESAQNTLLKVDDPFDLGVIRGERDRIDAYLKERGFYYFGSDYLLMKVDSTIGDHKVNLFVTVKPDAPEIARQIYRINDVFIYSNYSLNTANVDTNQAYREFYKGYWVIDKEKKFKPRMFEQAMQFNPGDVYNRTNHNQTLNRLINLNEFKFVKNRFEPVYSADTAKLDAYYYLTPLPKKSLRAAIDFTSRSNNQTGSQITFSWLNRNAFRAGEQVRLSAYVGSEIQASGNLKGFNTYRSGAQIDFLFPKFILPYKTIHTRGGYVPKTNIQLGFDLLNKQKLYTLNSYRLQYGFLWKESIEKSYEFYPVAISLVQPSNITKQFTDSANKYPYLQHVVERQYILGSTFQFLLNQNATGLQKLNSFYLMGLLDLSGNIAGLATGASVKKGKSRSLNGIPFAEYIKFEADGRYYRKIGLKSTWANRIDIGVGIPHGNSIELPFVKQFFVGGNSSNRAFRSRSVGPGTFRDTNITKGFLPDQTGDIKLELNTEFRPHLTGPLYGAVFIDAGNVWLKNADTARRGGEFSGRFLSELAVGAGVGLRLDIQLFVVRLDVGIPLRKPWLNPGNRWVIDQIKFNDKDWRGENIIYNIAIGYPF
jgi:outer membrane protein assembly factor BamA